MDTRTIIEALKFWRECQKHDPSGVLNYFLPLYYVEAVLQKRGLPEQVLKDRLFQCFCKLLQRWGKANPDYILTDTDLFWIAHIISHMGIGDIVSTRVVNDAVNENLEDFRTRIRELIPNLEPMELTALLLSPPNNLTFPPGHPIWLARGVKDVREWRELGLDRIFKDLANVKKIVKEFAIALRRAFERHGASEKASYVSEYPNPKFKPHVVSKYPEIEPSEEDKVQYLNDSDRLSQFCELAGVDMDVLTDSESSRILDLLNALDIGYGFASKQGVSIAAYYGDKADSEKTQRQRLFQKMRIVSKHKQK